MVDVKGILASFCPNRTTVAQLTMAHLLQLVVSCSTFKTCRATWDTSRKLHLWFGNYSRKQMCLLSCNYERSTEKKLAFNPSQPITLTISSPFPPRIMFRMKRFWLRNPALPDSRITFTLKHSKMRIYDIYFEGVVPLPSNIFGE